MSENIKSIEKQSSHTVFLEDRKKITITAVTEVVSATDKTVLIKTKEKIIVVNGSQLRVSKLNLEEGLLIVDGVIDSFKYQQATTGKGILKRIFK